MIAKSLGAFAGAGFSTIPVSRCSRSPAGDASTMPYFEMSLRRHAHQRDHRRVARLGHVEQLAQTRPLGVENIVGQNHRERLVADCLARLQHRVPKAQRLSLIGARYPRHRRSSSGPRRGGRACRAPRRWRSKSGTGAKWSSTSERPGATTMTISSMPEAIASSTTTWIAGRVDDRQNFLGDDAGGWQHARAKSGRHHHGLANFHRMPQESGCLRDNLWECLGIVAARRAGVRAGCRLSGPSLALARFLCRLAGDAERGHRARLEPLDPDFAAAFLALAIDAVVDAAQRPRRSCSAACARDRASAAETPGRTRARRGRSGRRRLPGLWCSAYRLRARLPPESRVLRSSSR